MSTTGPNTEQEWERYNDMMMDSQALAAARAAEAEAVEACVTFVREIAGHCFDGKKQPVDTGTVESLVENLDTARAAPMRLEGKT